MKKQILQVKAFIHLHHVIVSWSFESSGVSSSNTQLGYDTLCFKTPFLKKKKYLMLEKSNQDHKKNLKVKVYFILI